MSSSSTFPAELFYDLVRPEEVQRAFEIESLGYPIDEAATLDALRYRQEHAPRLFLGAYIPIDATSDRKLVAFVVSTLSEHPTLTHASMSTHVPQGSSVCMHSVCVDPEFKRRGIALALLREYLRRLEATQASEGIDRVLLLCHEELIELYAKVGFQLVGKSEVAHGPREWFEMRILWGADHEKMPSGGAVQGPPMDVPPEILAALARHSSRPKPAAAQLLSSFESIGDVIDTGEDKTNKHKLACVREGCGSLILLPNVARFVEGPSVEIDPPSHPSSPLLPPLPTPPATTTWWLITPSPMQFENIGFSKPVPSLSALPSGKRKKLLACAECDLGPIGWCEEGGTEFWVSCQRVAYR
ncbi:hypothetical protein BOTBODRAFT_37197 [Botryobasidium botryosum FD-172 SS1]|uniref:N-acetyltransferase domain-containing protein n=1 Tax=Botryobasidium botryosum (strain FD-172 SS1) TaxID=930990 RepID=A0A067M155_BOTB1|nr:hypothetical protein BOTBODRAFT_37197 [Botryobasidium botryosum FD-172 SS1]